MAAPGELRVPGVPGVRVDRLPPGTRPARGTGVGPGDPVQARMVVVRRSGPARADRAEPPGPDRGRGPPDLLQDEPAIDRSPPGPDGLHRGPTGLAGGPDRGRAPHCRPVYGHGLNVA